MWACLEVRVASHRDSTSLRWRHRKEINSLHSEPSSLLPIHQKLPGVCAFFITRVNICHVNKARGCFSPLRNRICNNTAPLMFLGQYNMYLNEDESCPVKARPQTCLDGGEPGRGRGGMSGRGSARQEVGWASSPSLLLRGLTW